MRIDLQTPDLVDLCRGLREATANKKRWQARITQFLALVLPSWRARFPARLGWTLADPAPESGGDAALEVWGVFAACDAGEQAAMVRAAKQLFARGFRIVRLHDHDKDARCACACKERRYDDEA